MTEHLKLAESKLLIIIIGIKDILDFTIFYRSSKVSE